MKRIMLLSFFLFSLAAGKKDKSLTPITTMPITGAKTGTIPDNAVLRIRLFRDSSTYDQTMFKFNHAASLNYNVDEDVPYFMGFGDVSLATLSANGKDEFINTLPYTAGTVVGLDVQAKTSGICFLEVNYKDQIPANVQVWIRDEYLKQYVNISAQRYKFNIIKNDASSFGNKRFKLVLKDVAANTEREKITNR